MVRRIGSALVGTAVLAALAGCAHQESFGLPELTPRRATSGVLVNPGYGYGGGAGYGYGTGAGYGYGYGYPNGYPPGYGYADPYYAGQGPYPYGSGRYAYSPYPRYVLVPCADNNGDGRCDRKPRKGRDRPGDDGQNDGEGEGHDRNDRPVPPRYVRETAAPDARSNTGQRARRDAAPVVQSRSAQLPATVPVMQSRSVPTPAKLPAVQQPARARPESRRATSPLQEP